VAVYAPFHQGYRHDWRLEEMAKERAHRTLSEKRSSFCEEILFQTLRALALQAEMNREGAEFIQGLRMLFREQLEGKKNLFEGW
jgi:hypothetical protein